MDTQDTFREPCEWAGTGYERVCVARNCWNHKGRWQQTKATYRDKYAEAAGVLEEVLRSQLNETVELDRTFAVEIMEMLRRA